MKKMLVFGAAVLCFFPLFSRVRTDLRANFTWDWEGPEAGIVWRLGIDPSNSNLALAATDGGHLWRTIDGNSWILIPEFRYSNPRVVLYTAPDTALAMKKDSLFYTPDGGNNWYPTSTQFFDIDGLSEQVSNIVYLSDHGFGDAHVLYRSTDRGLTWALIDTVFNHEKFFCIRYDPSNDSIIYYALRADQGSADTTVILKSTDMGTTWTRIFEQNSSFQNYGFSDIEVNPYNSDEIFACSGFEAPGTGPLYSSDGGNTWEYLIGAIVAGLILPFDVEFSDSDTVMVTNMFPPGIFMGVHYPAVGWQFFRVDSSVAFSDVEIGSGGTYYSGTTADGIYKSTNGGFSWSPANTNLRAHLAYSFSGENVTECVGRTLYTKSIYSTPIYKTTNGGLTWQKLFCPYAIINNAIEVYPGNPDIVYFGAFGGEFSITDTLFFEFFRSMDGGQTWTPMDTTVGSPTGPNFAHLSLWVSPTDSSRLVSLYLPNDTIPIIMRSVNSGADWDTVFFNAHFTSVTGTDTVFCAADTTLYVSFDKAASWQPLACHQQIFEMSYNPGNHLLYVIRATGSVDSLSSIDLSGSITNLAGMPGGFYSMSSPGGNNIYISTWTGGYLPLFIRSTDGGASYDVDTLDFLPVELRATTDEILLADIGSSFRRSTDALGVALDNKTTVSNFTLKIPQTIFSTSIKLECSLARSERIEVSVWSIDGRLVKTVHQGRCDQGTHTFVWDGSNEQGRIAPSGIYFVRMDVKGKSIPASKVIKVK
jgi:photosystem II stability/assembly factor-like uncharacterized protein